MDGWSNYTWTSSFGRKQRREGPINRTPADNDKYDLPKKWHGYFLVWLKLFAHEGVSNIGFITVHGHNEGHITPSPTKDP